MSIYDIARKEARDEITDHTVYKKLSSIERDQKAKKVFSALATTELRHYNFWLRYCNGESINPDMLKVYLVIVFRYVIGAAFVIKYLEKNEASVVKEYKSISGIIPKKHRKEFDSMLLDEEHHEQAFADSIHSTNVRYISFIVLGLADALVEIAGIHAGSLGIYNSTILTGLAGIVAGAAASISMASAAYAQSRQGGFEGSSKRAAAYTGLSYFVSAVILASPYFITDQLVLALVSSLGLGVLIIAFVSWYNSVISGSAFKKDFLELTSVMFAATLALFAFGLVIRSLFGITI